MTLPENQQDGVAKSYIANIMNFAVNLLWIAIGCALLAIARSFAGTNNRGVATAIGTLGVVALVTGMLF